jgi:hypothetical protein
MHSSAGAVLKNAGLSPTETKNYPLGVKDLAPVLKGFKAAGVDMLVGLTYPPDNILLTTQAKEADFNPPVYFTAVGTAFPFYRDRFKGAEGVSGIAGWNPKVKTPGAREYFEAHVKKTGKEPDRWASAFAYASLQITERCVGEVGLDRTRIKEMLDATEFTTVVGPVRFTRGVNTVTPGMVASGRRASSRSSGSGPGIPPLPSSPNCLGLTGLRAMPNLAPMNACRGGGRGGANHVTPCAHGEVWRGSRKGGLRGPPQLLVSWLHADTTGSWR